MDSTVHTVIDSLFCLWLALSQARKGRLSATSGGTTYCMGCDIHHHTSGMGYLVFDILLGEVNRSVHSYPYNIGQRKGPALTLTYVVRRMT